MQEGFSESAAFQAAMTYERFFVANIFRYWTPLLLDRVRPQPGEHALDVACGTGVVARSMVPLVAPAGRVVGLDKNTAMLEVACKQVSEHCEQIEWHEGLAEELPFSEGMFDLLTCQQAVQFFTDRPKAAAEMLRVLRPGGRVGIEVWQSTDQHPVYQRLFEALSTVFSVPIQAIAAAFSFGDPRALADLLSGAGFRDVAVEDVRHEVAFPEPERFIELTIRGAAAVIPAFALLDASIQSEMLADVRGMLDGAFSAHMRGGALVFPMAGNIATAKKR